MLGEWVGDVAVSANLVILRTPPGCAHVVASALDRSGLDGLLGTVAGDDTLLCVADPTTPGERPRRPAAIAGRPRRRRCLTNEPTTLWHGRFAGGPADALLAYTVSLPFDRRLWRDDIAGSRAHVGGLARAGLLQPAEQDAVLAALDRVEAELAAGTFEFVPTDEDIHTAVERRVTELAGPAGAKLHTARSRNDQVATDLRLWCKRELVEVARLVVGLETVLLARAVGRRRGLPPRLHAPPAGPAGPAGPPPAGPRVGAGP